MDPDKAFETLVDLEGCLPMADRDEAAAALADWLKRGGFPPTGMTRTETFAAIRAYREIRQRRR